MDAENNGICPVCTLYLRPGITLKEHLNSHPKQKVIEALINLTNLKINDNSTNAATSEISYQPQIANRPLWHQPTSFPSIPIPNPNANHSFIYQQFMSTSQPPLNQQYITVPTVFNPSMMCPPYVYQQQQQVFMSSSALPPNLIQPRTPIIDLSVRQSVCNDQNKNVIDLVDEPVGKKDICEDDSFTDDADGEEVLSPYENEVNEDADKEDEENDYSGYNYSKIDEDLNKACQTRQEPENYEEEEEGLEKEPESENFEFYSNSNVNMVPGNDQVLDLNGVQLLLCNDFMANQVISQVHDFECNNERPVLMSLGDSHYDNCDDNDHILPDDLRDDDGVSQGSATNLSIRANENMPPRGELSGQESNGTASDATWNRGRCESNSATSYDLFARETWEASNGSSDYNTCSSQSRVPVYKEELDDTPTIINVIEAPLNFKCPTCGERFKCPKERKAHQTAEHNKAIKEKPGKTNLIGANVLNKSTTKKLVIKPKRKSEIKNENNFEEVFNKATTGESNIGNLDSKELLGNSEKKDDLCNMVRDKINLNSYDCSICGAVYSDIRSIKRHKLIVHNISSRYKCDTCDECMKDQNSYLEHLKKHPLECKLCGKYFYRRQNMQLHMKRHLGIKPYSCEFCQKQFFSKQKLSEHRNTHTGDSPIKCNLCDDTFRRHSNLVQHRNTHHFNLKKKLKDYICHCGEVLHSKKKLAWHKEIHDVKPKACTKCSEKFVHMASLTRHMRRSHNDRFVPEETRTNENVECPVCKNVYLKSSLEAHMRRHNGEKGFMCSICNKEFTTKWNLKLHKWIHASRASKPFKCEHCKAAFIRETDFTAHMNSHKCVRPYTCNHCGAQFIRKSNCRRHVKEHEHTKTFTCQICGKAFHRSYYLKDHMRVHSGVRPYACHICGKTSTTKSNHNKHVMIHHAKEPVSTEN